MRLSLAPFLFAIACGSPPEAPAAPASAAEAPVAAPAEAPEAQPGAVDVAGLKAKLDAGPLTLIDVRTTEEYAGGHVPGAVNIPLDQLESRLSELESSKEQEIYLICASGKRSAAATALLSSSGFSQPVNVNGGTNGWRSAGYAVE